MSLGKLSATAALGLYLGFLPFSVGAQTADTTIEDEPAGVFVPIVSECLDAPEVDTCGDVRALVTECSAELTLDACEVLFEDADAVFADPALQEEAQLSLTAASEAIADMDFGLPDNQIDAAIEATRANSERTMLRGDENLNSHSGPSLVVDE